MDIDADGSIFEANDYEGNAYIFYVFVYIEKMSGPLYLPYWKRIQTMEGYDGSQSKPNASPSDTAFSADKAAHDFKIGMAV